MFIAVPPPCLSHCLINLSDVADEIVVYHRPKDYLLSVHSDQTRRMNRIVHDVVKRYRAGNLVIPPLKSMPEEGIEEVSSSTMVQVSFF